jgi:predicted enzyme involved in methoxymalonyl-ACP biosynthesis
MYKTTDNIRNCLDCGIPFDDTTFLKYRYLCTRCSSERKRIKKSFEVFLKDFNKDLDFTDTDTIKRQHIDRIDQKTNAQIYVNNSSYTEDIHGLTKVLRRYPRII